MSPTFYRLLEHMAYTNTQDASESPSYPNEGGAENLLLGTVDELQSLRPALSVTFSDIDIKNCFNEDGEPIQHPVFTNVRGGRTFLVAWVIDPSDDQATKINVFGVYKIKGMQDILSSYNRQFQWKALEISENLLLKLTREIVYKNGVRHIPTPDYKRLPEEEKKVKEYHGHSLRTKKVPVKTSGKCIVS